MQSPEEELGKVAEWLQWERSEDYAQHEAVLLKSSIAERRKAGLTWFPLRVVETGFGFGAYPFIVVEKTNHEQAPHSFQSGGPVSLFSAAHDEKSDRITGVIAFIDQHRMKISFQLDDLPEWVDLGKLGVDALFDSKSYEAMFHALNQVINVQKGRLKELRDTLLGYRTPQSYPREVQANHLLNDSQMSAVRSIVSAEDVAIIHGPPGTGKTTTLVHAVKELVQLGKKIMVCAPSNAATDHVALALHAIGLKVVRIGNLMKMHEDTTDLSIDVRIQSDRSYKQIKELKKRAAELRRMAGKYKRQFGKDEAEQRRLLFEEARASRTEARELERYLVDRTLDEAQVIACTPVGSTSEFLAGRMMDVVIMDEAGQGIEPMTWVPILKANMVVMAGDPFQLPPTVKSQQAMRAGLSKTLLEKAIQRVPTTTLLEVQYRMHEIIMGFSNERFYEQRLKAHASVANRSLPGHSPVLEFIDTAGTGYEEQEGEEGTSLSNPGEAALILRHIERTGIETTTQDVAIISPYRGQVNCIRELLGSEGMDVNTVDSFQGQERDVVYISLVRSNEKSEIGFLKDYRRMNVALTRARMKLVVVGDSATLGADSFYEAFLQYAEKQEGYRSAWEWM
jgi:ATP-dependent RNA/DNA helicase IGHMBP2